MVLKEEYSERHYDDPNLFKYKRDEANKLHALILELIRRENEASDQEGIGIANRQDAIERGLSIFCEDMAIRKVVAKRSKADYSGCHSVENGDCPVTIWQFGPCHSRLFA